MTHYQQWTAEQAYRDAVRAVVEVRSFDPATVWAWLRTMSPDRLYALVTCLACWADPNATTSQNESKINEVVGRER